ncbi:hypothetical protein PanWU01x14_145420 [Parasponia andersonii]|uniref:Uncharacterized protein n=1 Tax=Parasponia andersonii TaxID=3476 RepID=A0A2P5CK62_PARAD|nr:hypothetical protein PanWU01x14_145420 [Parasponia andersonii]
MSFNSFAPFTSDHVYYVPRQTMLLNIDPMLRVSRQCHVYGLEHGQVEVQSFNESVEERRRVGVRLLLHQSDYFGGERLHHSEKLVSWIVHVDTLVRGVVELKREVHREGLAGPDTKHFAGYIGGEDRHRMELNWDFEVLRDCG